MSLALLIALLVTPIFWLLVVRDWRAGYRYMLLYIPFGGIITLALYPSPIPTLFSDIFFVIPLYITYFIYRLQSREKNRISVFFILLVSTLTLLAIVQLFNPYLENLLVGLIGLKVWLFYIPLVFITVSLLKSREDLVSLFRFMVVIGWIPCIVGISTWIASMTFGHTVTMEALYGPAAKAASQNLVTFMDGVFFRIPSTFTYVAQYFGFTLAMIVPAYGLMMLEKSRGWRRFSAYSLFLFSVACLMSGSRGAFVFVPLFLLIVLMLNGKLISILKLSCLIPLFAPVLLLYIGIDTLSLFNLVTELLTVYATEIVVEGFVDSLANAPLGLGTGMNTGASRYAFDDQLSFNAFENYYAKAVYEFGFLGLITVLGIFSCIILKGFKVLFGLQDRGLRGCCAVVVAFLITMVFHSLKGWQIDMVPINTYFWVFTGVLFSIGSKSFLTGSQVRRI